ncbi:LOW QUALITY PROTEIN: uncharacterized protein [Amphiura filiformis]|uniref:LOW QUALITY PROTEIN: uncharacterized protein n=1 Tax=Amphiura filiformis TaxID=82378 RepID=UPI003B220FA7
MARCEVTLPQVSYVNGFTALPAAFSDASPGSSGTMGSVSSLVGDSGYRGGSSRISDITNSSEGQSSYYEDQQQQQQHWGPPRIMPISGKLEKHKEKRLIRPIAVKPSSPSQSPSSTSSKPSLSSDSPGMLDDIPELTQPDVVLANQMRRNHYNNPNTHYGNSGGGGGGPSTKRFGAPPTKAQSLQDINTPTHQNYRVQFKEAPARDYDSRGRHDRLQPSQSMNHLDQSWQNDGYDDHHSGYRQQQQSHYNQRLQNEHIRKPYSQSSTVLDIRNGSYRQEANRINGQHSMSSNHLLDIKHSHERSSSSSHVSSVLEDIEDEEIVALREKIKDQESELATLRDTMEKNEATIFEVYEEKQRRWEDEITRLRHELQKQDDGSRQTRLSLQGQIYKLEQDRKALQSKLDHMQQEKENRKNLDANQNDRNFVRPSKSTSRERIHEIGDPKTQQKDQKHFQSNGLRKQTSKIVACSEMDLRSVLATRHLNGHAKHGSFEQVLREKEAELNQAHVEIGHIRVIKENLSQQVKVQEEELSLLRKKLEDKEQELSQEKCEVDYLREVQDKLNHELTARQREARASQGGKGGSGGNIAQLAQIQDKLAQKHRELSHMAERLKQMQAERDNEGSSLRVKLKERNEEIKKLQNKVRFLEKERGRSGGKHSKVTPAQRQLESDFMDLQVKLTKKERELFKTKQELLSIQEKNKYEMDVFKSRLKQREDEQRTCLEELKKREAEMSRMMDRLDERKSESEKLNGEIERLKRHSHKSSKTAHVQEMERQMETLAEENDTLRNQMDDLKDDNSLLQEKLGRISLGVRNLSSSQLNLLGGSPHQKMNLPNLCLPTVAKQNALISKAIGSTAVRSKLVNGSSANKTAGPVKANTPMSPEHHITLTGSLRREMGELKKELNAVKQKNKDQEARLAHERKSWHDEKEKVIAYQKQLQLNYVQMCQRNKNLEQEVQQLTTDLEQVHKEISHC